MKNIHVVGSLSTAPTTPISPEECDIVEVRLDADLSAETIRDLITPLNLPILITARDIREGGCKDLTVAQRTALITQWIAQAHYLDIELRNWSLMEDAIGLAHATQCQIIASYHDFEKTPSQEELDELMKSALQASPDIIKFAFFIESLADIERCQKLLFQYQNLNISIMGMGPYAPVSRVLLAQSGSVLNYGYLGQNATAPGQWPARLLKEAITSCQPIHPPVPSL